MDKEEYGHLLEMAKVKSLTEIAKKAGFTVVRSGLHTCYLKEMDSCVIFNDRTWYRFSSCERGDQVAFLQKFCGMTHMEALEALTSDNVSVVKKDMLPEEKGEFILPEKAANYKALFSYLMKVRCLSYETIKFFLDRKMIYQERKHNNIVFLSFDGTGTCRHAHMKGTYTYGNTVFKGDVANNDKNYGFNVVNFQSEELIVFEAAIDLMSYCEIYNDFQTNKLALNMLADKPLIRFLEEHDHIHHIVFCLDNDKWGRAATEKYITKYSNSVVINGIGRKYTVSSRIPENKDWNEDLQKICKKGMVKSDENR